MKRLMRLSRKIRHDYRTRFRLLNARTCIRKMGFILEAGLYFTDGENFRPAEKGDLNPFRLIRIGSGKKYPKTYTEGKCFITSYHWTLVFDDYSYQIEKHPERYEHKAERVREYWHKLPYPTMEVILDDDYRLYIYRTVHGKNYFNDGKKFDEDHFYDYLDFLFSSLIHADIQHEKVFMKDAVCDICYCVQHGDPYYKNVIWTDNGPVIIDTDDIGYFPLFYDVFHFLIHSSHRKVFSNVYEFMRTEEFQSRMEETCRKLGIEHSGNVADLYLAALIYHFINRMDEYIRLIHIDYIMHRYEHADLSGFPLVSEAVEEYHARLKRYGTERTLLQELCLTADKKALKFKDKAWKAFGIRKRLKRISFLLEDGEYYYNQGVIKKIKDDQRVNPLRKIRIKSSGKNQTVYDHGMYDMCKAQTVFTFEDMTYYIVKDPAMYAEGRSGMEQYLDKLPYSTPDIAFYDDRCMYACKTVGGLCSAQDRRKNVEEHFDECLAYLFDSLDNTELCTGQYETRDRTEDVYCCVQHGNCRSESLVWTESGPVVINPVKAGEYPLFFDVISFVHSVHRERAFILFKDRQFIAKVEETCGRLGIPYDKDLFDRCLTAYVYRIIDRMRNAAGSRDAEKDLKGFLYADLSAFPMTADAVEEYKHRL